MFKLLKYELKKANFFLVYAVFIVIVGACLTAIVGVTNLSNYFTVGVPPLSLVMSVNIFTIIWTLMLCTYLGIELFHNEYEQGSMRVFFASGLGRTRILLLKAALLYLSSMLMGLTVVLSAFFAGRPLLKPETFWPYLSSSAVLALVSSSFVFLPLAIGLLFKRKIVTIFSVVGLLLVIGGSMSVSSFTNRPTQILIVTLATASLASFYAVISHSANEDLLK